MKLDLSVSWMFILLSVGDFGITSAFVTPQLPPSPLTSPSSHSHQPRRCRRLLLPGRTTKLPMLTPSRNNLKELEWTKPTDEQVKHWLKQYGEVSRWYRQDVFDPSDWVRSRRPTRFVENIMSTWKSGLIRQISFYVEVLAAVSAIVVIYNNLHAVNRLPFGLCKFLPMMKIPLLPFNLAAGSLGLLLTFRTNVCYQRWNEGRSAWGKIINDSRSLVRMACIWGQSYSKTATPALLHQLGDAVCSFSRSVMNRTLPKSEDETNFVKYCQSHVKDEIFASNLYNSSHRPTRALAEITAILVQMDLNPLHQIEIEKMVTELCSALGVCERILTSPIPTFYSRHTSRFLAFWLFFLPMALYDTISGWRHFALIPVMMVLGGFMLGIEELSCQLEEPFSILPMSRMCEDSIRAPIIDQVERSVQQMEESENGAASINGMNGRISTNDIIDGLVSTASLESIPSHRKIDDTENNNAKKKSPQGQNCSNSFRDEI
ncbi:bestrophin, RFP-TM, chloride channel [Nitzschia inconspicua]|uniref:Bestrophin, RFP-TM, chloride channel n=1 Tax=Nitzschia inconspicua TaxID=303405 RepID=A0A9K3Q4G4_9STRA|nr:bestrophin, RFP-TM, chloride channel [Nitzschia inconspicua]KAG7370045.1 bestrophin, RFP-TM, chloride channel [Nitzschia inconspicua]